MNATGPVERTYAAAPFESPRYHDDFVRPVPVVLNGWRANSSEEWGRASRP